MSKSLVTLQKWVLLITVFLFPLFFLSITQEFYITNKFFLLLSGVLAVIFLSTLKLLSDKKITLTSSPFDKVLMILLIAIGASIIFSSPNKIQAFVQLPNGFGPILTLVVFYFLAIALDHNKKTFLIIKTLRYSAYVLSLIVLIFYFNPLKQAQLPIQLEFLKNPSFSPLGNILDTAIFLGFFAFIEIGALFKTVKKRQISLLNGLGTIVVLIAVTITIFAIVNPADASLKVRFPPLSTSWQAAIESLKNPQTALTGVGVDNFSAIFTNVKPISYNTTDLWQLNFTLARSSILHIWAETGLLGMAAVLLLWVYVLRELRGLHKVRDSQSVLLSLLGGYLLLILLFLPPSYLVFFLLFIYLAFIAHRSLSHQDNPTVQTIDLSGFTLAAWSVAVVSLLLIGGIVYLAARVYTSEYYFNQSVLSLRKNDGRGVYDNLKKAIQLNPSSETFHTQFAQINLLLANNLALKNKDKVTDQDRQAIAEFIQQAISEAKVLVQLNPQKVSGWNTLALIYRNIINVAQGADVWTVAAYRKAILLDPNNPILRLNLGGVYYSLKNYDLATDSFEQAVALKPDWPNAYYNLAWSQFQNKKRDQAIVTMQNVLTLLRDPNSEDYRLASQNLEEFKQPIVKETEATQEGQLQINTPEGPELSPPLELPQESGPEATP
ncbi:hypothetical protein A3F34_03325 [Candidatus Roizmanbacteria bacterium RIFCSPHIGHO2_12_FULL_44_10]|uniref:Uncharacterized protein n=1 Tax=Candidatus Roizmanbacteria bacterium RIFCSPHIGHO2_12_FULL_44_10 TaxID=1802054 RepID=A0A1F7I9U9_9BACT|nr:MAG: hypothetical protein A3F34_03325 [Candidatus Roizmanbacteria bacterium RIFCSPHIGHO2_12_FULL_44_10]